MISSPDGTQRTGDSPGNADDRMRWADDGGEAPKFSNSQARAFTSTVRAQLLRRYGDDLPKRVDRAYRQWNRIVRDSIRSETALRLTVGDDSVAVPIEVVDGMPGPFVSHMGDLESGILWELILNKALLQRTSEGLGVLESRQSEIASYVGSLIPDGQISGVRGYVTRILALLERDDFRERFRAIRKDVLGAYYHRAPRIYIYWMVIGIVAAHLDVSVEALTIVVLVHEAIHAYTHLGKDIDGQVWDTTAFESTELHIVEGLAQFYTEVICRKLASRVPDVRDAFFGLLAMQPEPYTEYQKWASTERRRSEMIRFVMIETRAKCVQEHDEFLERLAQIQERIGHSVARQ